MLKSKQELNFCVSYCGLLGEEGQGGHEERFPPLLRWRKNSEKHQLEQQEYSTQQRSPLSLPQPLRLPVHSRGLMFQVLRPQSSSCPCHCLSARNFQKDVHNFYYFLLLIINLLLFIAGVNSHYIHT